MTKQGSYPKNTSGKTSLLMDFPRNFLFQKWVILVALSLLLSLLLTPNLNVIHPKYNIGSLVPRDIKADRDLLILDRIATEQKKMELSRNVEPVFDYDREIPTTLGIRIAKAFQIMEEFYNATDSEKQTRAFTFRKDNLNKARSDFEKAIGFRLPDAEFDTLNRNGFSNEIRDHLVRVIYSIYKKDGVSSEDFVKIGGNRVIILKNIKTQKEEELKDFSTVLDTGKLDPYLDRAAGQISNPEQRRITVALAKKLYQPNLTFNMNATEHRRQMALEQLKPVYMKIKKNEVIMHAGERVGVSDINKLDAFYQEMEGGNILRGTYFPGMFFMILLLCIILYQISKNLLKNMDKSNIDIMFLSTLIIIQVLIVRAGIFISESVSQAFPFIPAQACYFAIPFALGTMLVTVFLNRNIALIYSFLSSFLITFLFEAKIQIFIFAFLGSIVPAYHMIYFKQRSTFFKSGIMAGLINAVVIVSLSMIDGVFFAPDILLKIIMGLTGGVLSGILLAGTVPLFEYVFRYTTDIRLLELANLNQPILQRMIMEAPGTYHHSIIVASMVEAAAEAIQANSLLAKVSAYYHDIGKMKKPLYFIENLQTWKNKHDKLSPKMSSLIIISHVKDGCDLAKEYRLGRAITDIIRQHHGTSVVSFFYEKAQKDRDPSIRSIPESDFRYPGPKPQTKEAGLVLLGDIVEASTRTLTEPTPSRIKSLVQSRIRHVFSDGQLDDCELTFRDLDKIGEVFIRTLSGIFHQRIFYPEPVPKNGSAKRENENPDLKQAEKSKIKH